MGVLKELGADDKKMLVVLNKIDLVPPAQRQQIASHFDQPALVSFHTGEGVPEFLQRLSGMMLERTRRMKLRLPQSEFGIMSLIHQQGKVITQVYDGNDILLDIIVPRRFDAQLEPYLDPPLPARIPEAWETSGR